MQPAQQQPAVPGCPVRLVITDTYEKEDGSGEVLEVLQLPCRVLPCRNLDEPELASMVGVVHLLLVPNFWSVDAADAETAPAPSPLVVAHVLAGGQGPDIRLFPPGPGDPAAVGQERVPSTDLLVDLDNPALVLRQESFASAVDKFAEHHQRELHESGLCMLVQYRLRDLELIFVPVWVRQEGIPRVPAYWGYTVPAWLLTTMARVIQLGRLVVVLDLDETLLLASTTTTLQRRVAALAGAIHQATQQLKAAGKHTPQHKQLTQRLGVLAEEESVATADLKLLEAFQSDPAARARIDPSNPDSPFKDPTWVPVQEPSYRGPRNAQRPVVKLWQHNKDPIILTRVDPGDPASSMLLRLRPGWQDAAHGGAPPPHGYGRPQGKGGLLSLLGGSRDQEKPQVVKHRWEVYICTNAQRPYAEVAWSLLDPDQSVFPFAELSWRLLSVPVTQKKDLLNVLRRQHVQITGRGLLTDAERAARPPLPSVVPMCVIVDSRSDAYDPISNQALLQVLPYNAYRDSAVLRLAAAPDRVSAEMLLATQDSSNELARVRNTLKHLRSSTYMHLDTVIKPQAAVLPVEGCDERLQSTAAEILRWLRPLPAVQDLLVGCAHRPPASLPPLLMQATQQQQLAQQRMLAQPFVQQEQEPPPQQGQQHAAAAQQPQFQQQQPQVQQQQQHMQLRPGLAQALSQGQLQLLPSAQQSVNFGAVQLTGLPSVQQSGVYQHPQQLQYQPSHCSMAAAPQHQQPQQQQQHEQQQQQGQHPVPAPVAGKRPRDSAATAADEDLQSPFASLQATRAAAAAAGGGGAGAAAPAGNPPLPVKQEAVPLQHPQQQQHQQQQSDGGPPLKQQRVSGQLMPFDASSLSAALAAAAVGAQQLPLPVMQQQQPQQAAVRLAAQLPQQRSVGCSAGAGGSFSTSLLPQVPSDQQQQQGAPSLDLQQQQHIKLPPPPLGVGKWSSSIPGLCTQQQQQRRQAQQAQQVPPVLGQSAPAAAPGAAAAAGVEAATAPAVPSLAEMQQRFESLRQALPWQAKQQAHQQLHGQQQQQQDRTAAAGAAAAGGGGATATSLEEARAVLQAAADSPDDPQAQARYRAVYPAALQALCPAAVLRRLLQALQAAPSLAQGAATPAATAIPKLLKDLLQKEDLPVMQQLLALVLTDADVKAFLGSQGLGAAAAQRRIEQARDAAGQALGNSPALEAVWSQIGAGQGAAAAGFPPAAAALAAAVAAGGDGGVAAAAADGAAGASGSAAAAAAPAAAAAAAEDSGSPPARHEQQLQGEAATCPGTPPTTPPPPPTTQGSMGEALQQQQQQQGRQHQHQERDTAAAKQQAAALDGLAGRATAGQASAAAHQLAASIRARQQANAQQQEGSSQGVSAAAAAVAVAPAVGGWCRGARGRAAPVWRTNSAAARTQRQAAQSPLAAPAPTPAAAAAPAPAAASDGPAVAAAAVAAPVANGPAAAAAATGAGGRPAWRNLGGRTATGAQQQQQEGWQQQAGQLQYSWQAHVADELNEDEEDGHQQQQQQQQQQRAVGPHNDSVSASSSGTDMNVDETGTGAAAAGAAGGDGDTARDVSGGSAGSGSSAQQRLEHVYGKRVKYTFLRLEDGSIHMAANLHRTADIGSDVVESVSASDPDAPLAVELAARKLAGVLGLQ